MSTESSDLLAKSPVRMTDYEILVVFWDDGNFYLYRLQILRRPPDYSSNDSNLCPPYLLYDWIALHKLFSRDFQKNPDPPILAVFDFLAFFVF